MSSSAASSYSSYFDEHKYGSLSGWCSGVVTSTHWSQQLQLYFVCTTAGLAVMYPRVHRSDDRIGLGSFVRVRVSHRAHERNPEVQFVEWQETPGDCRVSTFHNGKGGDPEACITCNAEFVGIEDIWYIFENEHIGKIAVRDDSMPKRHIRKGTRIRVTCRRRKPHDGTMTENATWFGYNIDYAERETTFHRWFVGVITHVGELISITCGDLCDDTVIRARDLPAEIRRDMDSLLGRWVEFQVETVGRGACELRYTAMTDYREIDAVYQTQVRHGLPEILLQCSFDGEIEDGRPLLHSPMGSVRDDEGCLKSNQEGHYELWAVRHFRQNHSARWKISVFETNPVRKTENRSCRASSELEKNRKSDECDTATTIEQRLPIDASEPIAQRRRAEEKNEPKENREENKSPSVRSIMGELLVDDDVRDAICDFDPVAYNRLLELCLNL